MRLTRFLFLTLAVGTAFVLAQGGTPEGGTPEASTPTTTPATTPQPAAPTVWERAHEAGSKFVQGAMDLGNQGIAFAKEKAAAVSKWAAERWAYLKTVIAESKFWNNCKVAHFRTWVTRVRNHVAGTWKDAITWQRGKMDSFRKWANEKRADFVTRWKQAFPTEEPPTIPAPTTTPPATAPAAA
jgi:hypothetical protein